MAATFQVMFDSPALYPRPLVAVLREALADTPVVCLTGPRQSGKTTLVRAMMPERPYFSLDHPPYLSAAKGDPAGFVAALPSGSHHRRNPARAGIASSDQAVRGSRPAPRTLRPHRLRESALAPRCYRVVGRAHGDRPPHAPVRVREGTPHPATSWPISWQEQSPPHCAPKVGIRRRTRPTSAGVWYPGAIRSPLPAARPVLASGTANTSRASWTEMFRTWAESDDADGVARLLRLLAARDGELLEHGRSFPGTGPPPKHGARIHRGAGKTVPGSPPPAMAPECRKAAGEDAEDAPGRQRARRYTGRTAARRLDRKACRAHGAPAGIVRRPHQFVTAGRVDRAPILRFWHFRDKDGQEVSPGDDPRLAYLGHRLCEGDQHAGTVGGPRDDAPRGTMRG